MVELRKPNVEKIENIECYYYEHPDYREQDAMNKIHKQSLKCQVDNWGPPKTPFPASYKNN